MVLFGGDEMLPLVSTSSFFSMTRGSVQIHQTIGTSLGKEYLEE
jgi:hypothetical protein